MLHHREDYPVKYEVSEYLYTYITILYHTAARYCQKYHDYKKILLAEIKHESTICILNSNKSNLQKKYNFEINVLIL